MCLTSYAKFAGEYLGHLCRTLLSVASCHQFRTLLADRSKRQAGQPDIWRVRLATACCALVWKG